MRETPLCPKCKVRHWEFKPCHKGGPAKPILREVEGFSTWGNRHHTYTFHTDNVLLFPAKKAQPTGRVIPPEPEAA